MKRPRVIALLLVCLASTSAHAQWIKQNVNTTASLRGLSVVSEKIIWASGAGGTVIRTIDGGKTWNVIVVPGAEKLDFRDIEAFDANTAYVLSIGNGESSRIYKTTDGGKTWNLQFKNTNEKAFFDAIACWDRNNCIAMSDPVDGQFPIISTTDGKNWKPFISNQMAEAGLKRKPALVCSRLSTTRTMPRSRSTFFQRKARISPRRIPVASAISVGQ